LIFEANTASVCGQNSFCVVGSPGNRPFSRGHACHREKLGADGGGRGGMV